MPRRIIQAAYAAPEPSPSSWQLPPYSQTSGAAMLSFITLPQRRRPLPVWGSGPYPAMAITGLPITQTFHPSKWGSEPLPAGSTILGARSCLGKDLSASSTSLRTLPRAITLPKHNPPKVQSFRPFRPTWLKAISSFKCLPPPRIHISISRASPVSLTTPGPQPIIQVHSDKSPPRTSPLCASERWNNKRE